MYYNIPLSCGYTYAGQTSQCLNDHLNEHPFNLKTSTSSTLAAHCSSCSCTQLFHNWKMLSRYRNKIECEINEAFHIRKKGHVCQWASTCPPRKREHVSELLTLDILTRERFILLFIFMSKCCSPICFCSSIFSRVINTHTVVPQFHCSSVLCGHSFFVPI